MRVKVLLVLLVLLDVLSRRSAAGRLVLWLPNLLPLLELDDFVGFEMRLKVEELVDGRGCVPRFDMGDRAWLPGSPLACREVKRELPDVLRPVWSRHPFEAG